MCEIQIWINRQEFEYDIYTLVRAFYPQVRTTVHHTEDPQDGEGPGEGQISVWAWCEEQKVCVGYRREGQPGIYREAAMDTHKDRKETKSRLKQLLYRVLEEATGQNLVWGNLTGIRPVKLAAAFLEEGMDAAQARARMEEKYYLDRSKSDLCVEIALREKEILQGFDPKEGYSLYVGIPFCPSICMYCSFSSYPLDKWKKRVDAYVDALCKEIRAVGSMVQGRRLHTIYIGGGTPTTLEPGQMDRVLSCLEENLPFSDLREFTAEAGRPDSITREKLEVFREHKVTRLSVNPQTMEQRTLDLIGRRHTVEDVLEAYQMVREMGFDNVNMDLIVGLPGEGIREVGHTLSKIRKLAPDSLTVHSLAIKRAAELNLRMQEYQDSIKGSTNEMLTLADRYAAELGMVPYYLYRQKNIPGNLENVGYARPGMECLYNVLIMEEKMDIIAVGAGTSTKLTFPEEGRIERVENVKNVEEYIRRIEEMILRKKTAFRQKQTDATDR